MTKQSLTQKNTNNVEDEDYLDTRDAAIEADREARKSSFPVKGPKSLALTQNIVDHRNKYGTGSVAYIIKDGCGRVVNYVEDYPTTTYPIKNWKAHGDEITCDKSHRVVRRWENGKIVPRTKTVSDLALKKSKIR